MVRLMLARMLCSGLLVMAAPSAWAGSECADREDMVQVLADRYGETRRSLGVAANNGLMELFASTKTGSWTITVTMPDGQMCLVASGRNFEATAEELPAKGARI
ncbi:MAG: hypothetical protein HC844_02500 [Tabrizicola sp.]|nr:hypothetical protein [Tabrizicola sp.]